MEHKIWGIYDTVEDIWFGDDDGPKLFRESPKDPTQAYMLARIAAQQADVRLKQAPGRTVAREFPYDPKSLHIRDEVPTFMSNLEAIQRMEAGTDIYVDLPEKMTLKQDGGEWTSAATGTEPKSKQ